MTNVDIEIEEVDRERGVQVARKFIEHAVDELSDPDLSDHDIQHVIFSLQSALSFLA